MAKNNDWKTEFKRKTEEELFQIYCGFPKSYHVSKRYYAARVLESRDFKFNQISVYKEKWRQEKLQKQATPMLSIFVNFVASLSHHTQKANEEKNLIELSH